MTPRLQAATLALLLAPAAADAALTVHIEQKQVAPSAAIQWVDLDMWLEDPDGQDESLNAFRVYVDGPGNTPGGVRFDPPKTFGLAPSSAVHPPVFPEFPYEFAKLPTTFNRLGGGAESSVDVNVSPARNGLISLPVLIPAGASPGVYTFLLDADDSIFSRSNSLQPGPGPFPTVDPIPFTVGQPGRVTITPEPTIIPVATLGAALLLRRRRR